MEMNLLDRVNYCHELRICSKQDGVMKYNHTPLSPLRLGQMIGRAEATWIAGSRSCGKPCIQCDALGLGCHDEPVAGQSEKRFIKLEAEFVIPRSRFRTRIPKWSDARNR